MYWNIYDALNAAEYFMEDFKEQFLSLMVLAVLACRFFIGKKGEKDIRYRTALVLLILSVLGIICEIIRSYAWLQWEFPELQHSISNMIYIIAVTGCQCVMAFYFLKTTDIKLQKPWNILFEIPWMVVIVLVAFLPDNDIARVIMNLMFYFYLAAMFVFAGIRWKQSDFARKKSVIGLAAVVVAFHLFDWFFYDDILAYSDRILLMDLIFLHMLETESQKNTCISSKDML